MGNYLDSLGTLRIDVTPERAALTSAALGLGLAGLAGDGVLSWSRSSRRSVLTGVTRNELAAACELVERRCQEWSAELLSAGATSLALHLSEIAGGAARIRYQAVLNETQAHLLSLTGVLPPAASVLP